MEGLGLCVKWSWRRDSGSAVCEDGLLSLILLKCESESFGLHSNNAAVYFSTNVPELSDIKDTGGGWWSRYFLSSVNTSLENKLDYSQRTFLKMVLLSAQTKGSIFFFSLGLSFVLLHILFSLMF